MGEEHRSAGRTILRGGLATLAAAMVLAACTPTPGPSPTTTTLATDPMPPVIQQFGVQNSPLAAPTLVTLGWTASDPNGDPLTCRLDADGDNVFELTYSPCPTSGLHNVPMPAAGSATATLEVSDGLHAPVLATTPYSVAAGSDEPFDIEMRGLDALDPTVAAIFADAAARWESAIPRGVLDRSASSTRPECLPEESPDLPAVIDDLIIDVSTPEIDGPGEILGQAGPSCIWLATEQPFHGVMRFDSDDVATMLTNGTLAEVIEHEIGHVLGIGTLWDMSWLSGGQRKLLSGAGGANPRFTGASAVAEFRSLGGAGDVPVENSGGPGTVESHWRESAFANELMTGWVNVSPNPTSRMTIASMSDMGFRVNLSAADPYSLPGSSLLRSARGGPDGEFERPPVGAD